MPDLYAVVMAGGRGERFWPLSTDAAPKPFVPLFGGRSLIQATVERLSDVVPPERILVSIGEAQIAIAKAQLPALPGGNFVIEPVGRDTAPCLGYCAIHLENRAPGAWMLAVPADHYVSDRTAFRRTVLKAMASLPGATAVVFGIVPSRPETGYGYVLAEKPAVATDAWPVLRFVEKPDAQHAAAYLKSGRYFWNSGMFLWSNRTLLELFRRHLPDTYAGLRTLQTHLGRNHGEVVRVFSELQRISVDFGILERISGLRLVPAEFAWDDIGNWSALERAGATGPDGNIAIGPHVAVDAHRCIVYSDSGPVAVFGVSDLVVVQSGGRVLVCNKAVATDLKRLVAALGPEGNQRPISNRRPDEGKG